MAEKCSKTKANGDRCGAWEIPGTGTCAGHAGLGATSDPVAYGAAGRASRKVQADARREERKMTLMDRIARQTEERAAEIVAAYFTAGERGDWRALEALVTRVHGKPVERVTVEPPADPLGVAAMTPEERSALVAQVLEQHPHLAVLRTADVQH